MLVRCLLERLEGLHEGSVREDRGGPLESVMQGISNDGEIVEALGGYGWCVAFHGGGRDAELVESPQKEECTC